MNQIRSTNKSHFTFDDSWQTRDENTPLTLWRPLLPHGYSYKASSVTNRVKTVICNFWHPVTLTLSILRLRSSERPDVKNYKRRLNQVWHRMLYSCTHMTTVGLKMFEFKCMKWKQITRHNKMNYGRCEQTIISNKQQFIRQKTFFF